MVRSILFYGCELWQARVAEERMLAVLVSNNLRRILYPKKALLVWPVSYPEASFSPVRDAGNPEGRSKTTLWTAILGLRTMEKEVGEHLNGTTVPGAHRFERRHK